MRNFSKLWGRGRIIIARRLAGLITSAVFLLYTQKVRSGSIFDDDGKPGPETPAKPPAKVEPPPPPVPRLTPRTPPPEEHAPRVVTPPAESSSGPPVVRPPVKIDVPSNAKLLVAEKLVKEVYRAEFANRSQSSQAMLGRALLNEAHQPAADSAEIYVLTQESRDAAICSGDAATAIEAIRELRDRFGVGRSGRGTEREALLAAAKALATVTSSSVPEAQPTVRLVMAQAERDLLLGNYDACGQLASQADAIARRASDPAFQDRVHGRAGWLMTVGSEYAKTKSAIETLQHSSSDPGASLAVGKFYLFILNQAERGLPLLAKGSDPILAALAGKELAENKTATDLQALADAWASAARSVPGGVLRDAMQRRALLWYDAAAGQAGGLTRMVLLKHANDLRAPTLLHGLRADYFRGQNLGVIGLTRIDSKLDFPWREQSPAEGIPGDYFSARWSGFLKAPIPGEYKLVLVYDDMLRIWIDGEIVFENWHSGEHRDVHAIHLSGALQQLKIEYAQLDGGSSLGVGWIMPRSDKQRAIPADALFHEPFVPGPMEPVAAPTPPGEQINLLGVYAELHNGLAYYSGDDGVVVVGAWFNRASWPSWTFEAAAGDYDVDITSQCFEGNEGSEYRLSVGNNHLTGKVSDSGGWSTNRIDRLGRVHLYEGSQVLRIDATSMPKNVVMNVTRVTLTPVK